MNIIRYSQKLKLLCARHNVSYYTNSCFNSLHYINNDYAIKLLTSNTKHSLYVVRCKSNETKQTTKEKFKKAIAEYGTTVIVFHISISLLSLAICYFLITNGVDLERFVAYLGLNENKLAANTGTFVVAYAVHKVFAPVRIGITLGVTPFIVRYLRKIGYLKPPPSKKM